MKLTKKELAIANGTSKTRHVLTNVLLRNGILTAADGFMLVSMPAPAEEKDNIPRDKDVFLPAAMFRKIKPENKGYAILEKTADGLFACSTYSHGGFLRSPKEIFTEIVKEGTFPDFRELFAKTKEKKAVVALSAGILRSVLDCLPADAQIRVGVAGPQDAVEISVPEYDIRGLIMPMFHTDPVKWGNDDPRWMDSKPAKEEEVSIAEYAL